MRVVEDTIRSQAPAVEKSVSKSYVDLIEKTEKETKVLEELLRAKSNDADLQSRHIKLERKLDSLLTQSIDVSTLSRKSETVTENFKSQTAIINNEIKQGAFQSDQKPEPGYPRTAWFKEGGYFLIFDDMKVTLDNINKDGKSISVSLCQSTSRLPCSPNEELPLPSKEITLNSPIKFERNGFEYTIRLDRIGSAGRNPFTKAAYVTLEKYAL